MCGDGNRELGRVWVWDSGVRVCVYGTQELGSVCMGLRS